MDKTTFSYKFERALQWKQREQPNYGLNTLARELAGGDDRQTQIIRRRLLKYRPPKGGAGAAAHVPTEKSRRAIEAALGLDRDALKPDDPVAEFLSGLTPYRKHVLLVELVSAIGPEELAAVA